MWWYSKYIVYSSLYSLEDVFKRCNNLMKLGGSLGCVPQKLKKKKLVIKT
jgi:hypothetical protein